MRPRFVRVPSFPVYGVRTHRGPASQACGRVCARESPARARARLWMQPRQTMTSPRTFFRLHTFPSLFIAVISAETRFRDALETPPIPSFRSPDETCNWAVVLLALDCLMGSSGLDFCAFQMNSNAGGLGKI